MSDPMSLEDQYGAATYAPLPVTLVRGEGVYLWDKDGNRYLDMMSAYSAVSHGHCHPELVETLQTQAAMLNVTSRAFYSDKLGPFLQRACELTGFEKAIPMNTGAEAVETALKVVRKWAYTVKGVPADQAEIIVCHNNFHGRTIAIVGFSSEPQYRDNFGPYPNGFTEIPFGNAEALEAAITPNTAAFLVEPIQGEAGIIMPPAGYLKQCETLCRKHNVLFLVDEIQTGLGRTGKLLAIEHEDVHPDGLILGKALGGGLLPVSLFLANKAVLEVISPGDHGSTFGGNALAASVAIKALDILVRDKLSDRSAELGEYFKAQLQTIQSPLIKSIRGQGLFIALEIDETQASARDICLKLLKLGLLSKETHETVVRLAPPLVITQTQIDDALALIKQVL